MATVVWNQKQNFSKIYRYDSVNGFSANLSTETDFDYFLDSFQAGDYIAFSSAYTSGPGVKYRNIYINVGTPISADSVVIKLQYNSNGTWYDVADITSYLTSAGQKEIPFEPPDKWKRTTINGQDGFWTRFYVESVTNPTEGGRQTTDTIQCGDNSFRVTDIGGSNPIEAAYQYDVSNSIGIITKVSNTYIIGKSYIVVGEDESDSNFDNTNVIFDDSDAYMLRIAGGQVTWINGYLHDYMPDHTTSPNSKLTIFTNLGDSTFKYWTYDHYSGYSSEETRIMIGKSGATISIENCMISLRGGVYRGGFGLGDYNLKVKNLVCNNRIEFMGTGWDIEGVVSSSIQLYFLGELCRFLNCKTESRVINPAYTSGYKSSLFINTKTDQGIPVVNNGGLRSVNFTYEPIVVDKDGNPVKDAVITVDDYSDLYNPTVSATMDTTSSIRVSEYNILPLTYNQIVRIGDELIRIKFLTVDNWVSCDRGVWGTTPAYHYAGDTIEVLHEAYFKTGYVDWDFTKEHFLSPTSVVDGSTITTFDEQPFDFTTLMIHAYNVSNGGYLKITGTNFSGFTITETVKINADGYYQTLNYFKSIDSVESSGLEATVSIGLYGTFYPQILTYSRYTRREGTLETPFFKVRVEADGYAPVTKKIYLVDRVMDKIILKKGKNILYDSTLYDSKIY